MTAGHTATWSSWWPYLSCLQRRSKQDFNAFSDEPQRTLWRSLSNMSLIIGLKKRHNHQPPGECSWKLLGQTTTSKGGTTPWTDAPRERPTYPCIASYSCSARKRPWLPCRFDLCPTRSFKDTREWLIRKHRKSCFACGKNTTMGREILNSYWMPVLI